MLSHQKEAEAGRIAGCLPLTDMLRGTLGFSKEIFKINFDKEF